LEISHFKTHNLTVLSNHKLHFILKNQSKLGVFKKDINAIAGQHCKHGENIGGLKLCKENTFQTSSLSLCFYIWHMEADG
jgi:hypothetical protein